MVEKDKKYYWLKLKKNFFKRHDIKIVESMENGKDYILFYLKMLVESVDHDGELRFSESIPYDERMLSTITNTNIDIVRSAMKIFCELKMIEIEDDRTIFMSEVSKMMGHETYWADKKRTYRKQIAARKEDNFQCVQQMSKQEIELELDIEKDNTYVGLRPVCDIKIDKNISEEKPTCLTFEQFWTMYDKKVQKKAAENAFKRVKEAERQLIKQSIDMFVLSTPDIRFRPNPASYLNGRRWEDDIVTIKPSKDITAEDIWGKE